eukprot:366912_1
MIYYYMVSMVGYGIYNGIDDNKLYICCNRGDIIVLPPYDSFIASSHHGFIQSLTSDILILFVLISLTYQLFIAPSTRNILSISSLAGDIIIVSLTGEVFIVAAGDPIISSPSHPFVVSSGSNSSKH